MGGPENKIGQHLTPSRLLLAPPSPPALWGLPPCGLGGRPLAFLPAKGFVLGQGLVWIWKGFLGEGQSLCPVSDMGWGAHPILYPFSTSVPPSFPSQHFRAEPSLGSGQLVSGPVIGGHRRWEGAGVSHQPSGCRPGRGQLLWAAPKDMSQSSGAAQVGCGRSLGAQVSRPQSGAQLGGAHSA